MNNLHGILFAYRSSTNLEKLVSHRTLASLPYGARYRLIDFMLSNLVNAGVTDVGVVMHESYQSLLDHLGNGKDWDLARKNGGLKLLPPFAFSANERRSSGGTYRGTMEALGGVYSYLQEIRQEYVILADTYIVANLPVQDILAAHISSGADITAVCTSVPKAVSRDSTYFITDESGRVKEVLVGPGTPSGLESLNVYVLSKELLIQMTAYCADHDIYSLSAGVLHPGKDRLKIIPYIFDGYANRIQTVKGYFDHSMQLLDPTVRQEVFVPERPIRTKERADPATYYAPSSKCVNSVVADGCVIEGIVENSVIFHGVHIGKGAVVRNCVIMQNAVIEDNVNVEYIVADKDVVFTQGVSMKGTANQPTTVGKGEIVR